MRRFAGKICFMVVLTFLLCPLSWAYAAMFIVSPPRFEITMTPGASTTEAIEVSNAEDAPLELSAYFMDWNMRTNSELSYIKPGTLQTSCTSWMKVNPQTLRLAAKESRLVRFTITAPQGTAGSYWTVLFLESKAGDFPKGTVGVALKGRVGVIIYATIMGTEVRSGKILDMRVFQDKEAKEGGVRPYKLALTFENTGNIYYRPKGTWEIKNEAGKRVKKGEIEDFLVLPKMQRTTELRLEEGEAEKAVPIQLPPGKYTLSAALDYGAPDLVGGDLIFEVPGTAPQPATQGK